ncbi:hypothetical protein [Lyngbya confervoides]|uniref:Uncharacterized protein n=1 Tax=Lyngbya confervoides BDU141951 TaxID=1574623 RepID=A0ABD4T3N1_9CYAN|nr:hypothetical protein [Lyngbya confervoides]MCM1983298.1 hypothetical protein [Lyngbya confervoides BDU141951]
MHSSQNRFSIFAHAIALTLVLSGFNVTSGPRSLSLQEEISAVIAPMLTDRI